MKGIAYPATCMEGSRGEFSYMPWVDLLIYGSESYNLSCVYDCYYNDHDVHDGKVYQEFWAFKFNALVMHAGLQTSRRALSERYDSKILCQS